MRDIIRDQQNKEKRKEEWKDNKDVGEDADINMGDTKEYVDQSISEAESRQEYEQPQENEREVDDMEQMIRLERTLTKKGKEYSYN